MARRKARLSWAEDQPRRWRVKLPNWAIKGLLGLLLMAAVSLVVAHTLLFAGQVGLARLASHATDPDANTPLPATLAELAGPLATLGSVVQAPCHIEYRLYDQAGIAHHGRFPRQGIATSVRRERWARLAHELCTAGPQLHQQVAAYLLEHSPIYPIKLELFAVRLDQAALWGQPMQGDAAMLPSLAPHATQLLGHYDGVANAWHAAKGLHQPEPANAEGEATP